jgi:hypothetical protein
LVAKVKTSMIRKLLASVLGQGLIQLIG